MSREAPWLLAVKADTTGAEERELIARSVGAEIGCHADWVLLETCHRVELYGFGAVPELEERMTVKTGDEIGRAHV